MTNQQDPYVHANNLCIAIQEELKRLNRWSAPLPDEAFHAMGAFGSNTMAFEQWIQFILIPRLQEIIESKASFPSSSSLGDYGIRVFDGDPNSRQLHQLLYQLDSLVNAVNTRKALPPGPPTISVGQVNLPDVVYELIKVLPDIEGADLESQFQTYDMFLDHCSPNVRPELSELLMIAANRSGNGTTRQRIIQAAQAVLRGGRAAESFDHEETMRKYGEENRKNFPLSE
jgi:uncharacterized protein YqcC (DUF446 family)